MYLYKYIIQTRIPTKLIIMINIIIHNIVLSKCLYSYRAMFYLTIYSRFVRLPRIMAAAGLRIYDKK